MTGIASCPGAMPTRPRMHGPIAGSASNDYYDAQENRHFFTKAFALAAIRCASIPISRSWPVGTVIWPQK
jgi:hypothetical protein